MGTATAKNLPHSLGDWDNFVASRYQEGKVSGRIRNYDTEANPSVVEFYRQNHAYQTFDLYGRKEEEYSPLCKEKKDIFEAAEFLNTLVDESNPDTDLAQIDHLLQIKLKLDPIWCSAIRNHCR